MTIQTITEISTKNLVVELEMATENRRKAKGNENLERLYKNKFMLITQELIDRKYNLH